MLTMLFKILSVSLLTFGIAANAAAQSAGPPDASHGFPAFYVDAAGTSLDICVDNAELCLLDNTPPLSFPDNFPGELFYQRSDAAMQSDSTGNLALLVTAVEASFVNLAGDVIPGDQNTFGRVRFRLDGVVEGRTYTITHPYGVDQVVATRSGARGVNTTEDIGCFVAPCDFTAVLSSRPIQSYLRWTNEAEVAPAGYVGTPLIEHRVTGSPNGTNFFRVEGTGIGAAYPEFQCGNDCIQTDLFVTMGKLSAAPPQPPTPVCGDGVVDAGEQCDDGGTAPGDGRDALCQLEVAVGVCGDGVIDAGEQCDDGGTAPGDGCDAACQIEAVVGFCGDGVVNAGEECDDGNGNNRDGCSNNCRVRSVCGDGVVTAGEQCDDGNRRNGDGCSRRCRLERN